MIHIITVLPIFIQMRSLPVVYAFISCTIIVLESILGLIIWKMNIMHKIIIELLALNIGTLVGVCMIELLYDLYEEIFIEKTINRIIATTVMIGGFLIPLCIELFIRRGRGNKFKTIIPQNNNIELGDVSDDRQEGLKKLDTRLIIIMLLGDMIHNFVDGGIVASAYLEKSSTGLATTIGIFLEEIPHLVGTYAVFMYSGLSAKKALMLNFIGALPFLLGCAVIVIITKYGHVESSQTTYLLAFAIGSFLYVALVDLLPIITTNQSSCQRSFLRLVIILIGIGIQASINVFNYKYGV